ncbi:MAG: PepSY domain-containing protein [Chitinophagales bacterium]|nr:PepSY domain-containing protein [Chitinophagales bacterium]
MKKTTITNITTLCVVLVGGLVANCSCSNNGATISPTTSPPPDSITVQKPKFAHLGRIPFEQWKDETKYVLSMLDDTVGLSTNNQFMLVKKISRKQGELIKAYAQMYKGVEVLGGGGNLIFEQDTLFSKTEHFYKISLDVTPSISEAQALAAIQADETSLAKNGKLCQKDGLVIISVYPQEPYDFHLCWTFIFQYYNVYVDAHTGKIVKSLLTVHN